MPVVPADPGDRPRRLLVITYHFPPDGSVGGLRWAGLSKYLARRGWEVHVITAARQIDQPPVPGVQVHYCPRKRTLNDVYNAWVNRAPTASAQSLDASVEAKTERAPSGMIDWLRTNLGAALVFPDEGRGWIIRATRAARAQLRAKPFDAVVTSGPPHSAHVVGTLACLGRRRLLVVDMRDPWTATSRPGPGQAAFSSTLMRVLVPRLERFVFRRRPRVVVNTAEFAEALRAHRRELEIHFVPNGVDVDRLPPRSTQKFDGLSLVYAGTMYLSRDLSVVLKALRDFLARYPAAGRALKLRVAGDMTAGHDARFRQSVAETGLGASVELLGRLSSTKAMDLINRSHLSLVLAQDQPLQVPAKLYECVALGVTTLVIAESTSAAAREATRIGAIACEPTDVEGVQRVIERLWLNPGAPPPSPDSISYETIAARMDALLRGDARGAR